MPKRAIVDVDATLWDMYGPVKRILEDKHNISMGEPDEWDYHRGYVTDDQFYAAVRQVHAGQLEHEPYPGAQDLFSALDAQGYEVIVASHRRSQTADVMALWLAANDLLPYTGIYCGGEKHFLMGAGDLVIDDRPDTIVYAQSVGAQALSLTYAYNQVVLGTGRSRTGIAWPVGFQTLEEMAVWIQRR